MFVSAFKKLPFKTLLNSLTGPFWLLFINLLVSTCADKQPESINLSKYFLPVYDSVNHLFELNRVNQGLHYLDSFINHTPRLSTADKFRAYSLRFTANNQIYHNNERALIYADSMLLTVQESNNPQLFFTLNAEANFAKGDALFGLGRYSEAYTSYYQGYLIGHNSYDNCTLSDYTYRMGMITYKQGDYKHAANYFKQSFKLGGTCKVDFVSFYRQQEVLDNIGLSYLNFGRLDSAMFYFDSALKYIEVNKQQYQSKAGTLEIARAVIHANQAVILINNGQYLQAERLLKRSIATNLKKGNDNANAQLSEMRLGELYIKQNKSTQLFPLLKELRLQLDSVKNTEVEAGWNEMMGAYYKNKQDFLSALPYIENSQKIKDSLMAKSHILKESNVNEHLNNIEKHYQIQALQNKQRIFIYTGVIFVSMSVIIFFLVYRNYKKSRQEMKKVNALNKQVIIQKEKLEHTLFNLESSVLEKDRILRTVAHDLRNPLGGIASLTGIMADNNDCNTEQLQLLKIIEETANDSLVLINEILEATDNTFTELYTQPVDINTLLNNSVELMRFKAAEKNQKILMNIPDTPEQLVISREKIWRVISNLISNAIKFSPVGSDIQVSLTNNINDVQISVNDHGIGIPENIKNKIFNIFTEAKRPGTLGEKSFGLGLSICRQIIEAHHGKIWFESNIESGTTFYICLLKNRKQAIPNKSDRKLSQKTRVPFA